MAQLMIAGKDYPAKLTPFGVRYIEQAADRGLPFVLNGVMNEGRMYETLALTAGLIQHACPQATAEWLWDTLGLDDLNRQPDALRDLRNFCVDWLNSSDSLPASTETDASAEGNGTPSAAGGPPSAISPTESSKSPTRGRSRKSRS